MSAPTNPPSAAALSAGYGVQVPKSQIACAAATAYDFTTRAAWANVAAGQPVPSFASELYFPTAGTFTGQMAGDNAAVAITVTAGTILRGAWVLVPVGNALAFVARG